AAELDRIEFGRGIMLIKQKFLTKEELIKNRDQKDQVRWIARMKNIESMPVRHLQGENEFPKKGDSIFEKISHGARAFHTPWMAVDVHTVYLLVCLVISPSFRTNDRNGVTSLMQHCGLLPDPAIDRDRQVLDDDKDRACRNA